MTAILAGGLLAAFCLVAGWSAWPLRPHGDQDQADNPETSRPAENSGAADQRAVATALRTSGWLPATLPAPPARLPPRRPRVCAGRVAIQSAPYRALSVRQQLLAATMASIGWPTPEGITA